MPKYNLVSKQLRQVNVCVCVCEREREREFKIRVKEGENEILSVRERVILT